MAPGPHPTSAPSPCSSCTRVQHPPQGRHFRPPPQQCPAGLTHTHKRFSEGEAKQTWNSAAAFEAEHICSSNLGGTDPARPVEHSLPFPPHSSPSSSVSHGGLAHASVGFWISACTGWCQFFTRGRTWRCVLQCEVLQDNHHGARRGVTGPVWCICLRTSASHGHTGSSVGWVCMVPTALTGCWPRGHHLGCCLGVGMLRVQPPTALHESWAAPPATAWQDPASSQVGKKAAA